MKIIYKVWFVQDKKNFERISAGSRDEARKIFADKNNVIVSNYIQCKRENLKQYNF